MKPDLQQDAIGRFRLDNNKVKSTMTGKKSSNDPASVPAAHSRRGRMEYLLRKRRGNERLAQISQRFGGLRDRLATASPLTLEETDEAWQIYDQWYGDFGQPLRERLRTRLAAMQNDSRQLQYPEESIAEFGERLRSVWEHIHAHTVIVLFCDRDIIGHRVNLDDLKGVVIDLLNADENCLMISAGDSPNGMLLDVSASGGSALYQLVVWGREWPDMIAKRERNRLT